MPAGRIVLKSISESRKLAALKTDGARLLYTWLIPHVDVNGCFSGDVAVIKGQVFTRLRKTDREIESFLVDLDNVGLIVRYEADGDKFIFLPSFEEKQPHLNKEREAAPRIPLPTQDQLKSKSGSDHAEIPLNLKLKLKVKEKVKGDPAVAQIVEYLNLRTGKNFRPGSESTARHIQARLAEGRTLEDFKHVIDVKAAKWLGDPKMDDFLRPETLFAASNFESYLNERIIQPKAPAHLRIGAGSEQRPMTKEQQAERDRLVHEISDSLDKEFGPQLEAARKAGDLAKVKQLSAEQGRAFEDRAAPVFYKYSNAGARP